MTRQPRNAVAVKVTEALKKLDALDQDIGRAELSRQLHVPSCSSTGGLFTRSEVSLSDVKSVLASCRKDLTEALRSL